MKDNFEFKDKYDINDLVDIMRILRRPGGCAWDREQTHKSIKNNMLEEAYEVIDAIDAENPDALAEELGDVLLQVVFHSEISEEQNDFNFSDVANGICKKLIYRHPHVFSDVTVSSSSEVLRNWEKLKQKEKSQKTATDTLLSVPKTFPALMRAQKVQKRAGSAGLDFNNITEVYSKISEELEEVKNASENAENLKEELGDLLFSCVNAVRLLGFNSEECLSLATEKFISRFEKTEKALIDNGKKMNETSAKELDRIWESIK